MDQPYSLVYSTILIFGHAVSLVYHSSIIIYHTLTLLYDTLPYSAIILPHLYPTPPWLWQSVCSLRLARTHIWMCGIKAVLLLEASQEYWRSEVIIGFHCNPIHPYLDSCNKNLSHSLCEFSCDVTGHVQWDHQTANNCQLHYSYNSLAIGLWMDRFVV